MKSFPGAESLLSFHRKDYSTFFISFWQLSRQTRHSMPNQIIYQVPLLIKQWEEEESDNTTLAYNAAWWADNKTQNNKCLSHQIIYHVPLSIIDQAMRRSRIRQHNIGLIMHPDGRTSRLRTMNVSHTAAGSTSKARRSRIRQHNIGLKMQPDGRTSRLRTMNVSHTK